MLIVSQGYGKEQVLLPLNIQEYLGLEELSNLLRC